MEHVFYSRKDQPLLVQALDKYVSVRHLLLGKGYAGNHLFLNNKGLPFADVATWSTYMSKMYSNSTGLRGVAVNEIRSCLTSDFRRSSAANDNETYKGFLSGMRHTEATSSLHYDKRTKHEKILKANAAVHTSTMAALLNDERARACLREFGHVVTSPDSSNTAGPVPSASATRTTAGGTMAALPELGDIVAVRVTSDRGTAATHFAKVVRQVADPSSVTLALLVLAKSHNGAVGGDYIVQTGSAFVSHSKNIRFPIDSEFDQSNRCYKIYASLRDVSKL